MSAFGVEPDLLWTRSPQLTQTRHRSAEFLLAVSLGLRSDLIHRSDIIQTSLDPKPLGEFHEPGGVIMTGRRGSACHRGWAQHPAMSVIDVVNRSAAGMVLALLS